jgi:hypothetical protein
MAVRTDSTHRPRSTAAFTASMAASGRLARAGRLVSPRPLVGARLHFADDTTSEVFRETAVHGAPPRNPAVLVVRFRLWLLGSGRLRHALFRRECVLHTPLFAGFPGFRSKLWLTDAVTGVYRGLYEWDGADRAVDYAETLCGLLRPLSYTDSVAWHVTPQVRRDDLLRDATRVTGAPGDWWRPDAAIRPAVPAAQP